ncbi:MAG: hypothetical protein AAGH90_02150 [Pseudomonadota bacterium]
MKQFACSLILLGSLGLASCGEQTLSEPVSIFPDAPAPTPFTRAYSMTEAPDGVRIFAKEDGDQTLLYAVTREGQSWSAPVEVELPHRGMITGPHFSRFDETFFFASNAAFPGREGNNDLNIWQAAYLGDGRFGEAQPLPMPQINTGANEIDAATTRDGRLFFVTNHSRAGGGGYDIMQARRDENAQWIAEQMPEVFNDRLADDHIAVDPNGTWLIFYSHRSPKAGSVDLWISEPNEQGIWQAPTNLGPFVNTTAGELGAGLSWDAETFFFSRDGALFEVSLEALLSANRDFPD